MTLPAVACSVVAGGEGLTDSCRGKNRWPQLAVQRVLCGVTLVRCDGSLKMGPFLGGLWQQLGL